MKRKHKGLVSYGIFYFNKVCSCKYSRAFVERPSQGEVIKPGLDSGLDSGMHVKLRIELLNWLKC